MDGDTILIWEQEKDLELSMTLVVNIRLTSGFLVLADGNAYDLNDKTGAAKLVQDDLEKVVIVAPNVVVGFAGKFVNQTRLEVLMEDITDYFGGNPVERLEPHMAAVQAMLRKRMRKKGYFVQLLICGGSEPSAYEIIKDVKFAVPQVHPIGYIGQSHEALYDPMLRGSIDSFDLADAKEIGAGIYAAVHKTFPRVGGKVQAWHVKSGEVDQLGQLIYFSGSPARILTLTKRDSPKIEQQTPHP